MKIPFLRPAPARLSELTRELLEIEHSGVFSNYGPVNTRFEQELTRTVFGSAGSCLTVANATLGLMLAIKQAARHRPGARFALMPSFTFAATAQAALWAGLTPLLCDIEPETWLPCPDAEDALLDEFGDDVAVVLPYATFGNCLDLSRYERLSAERGLGVVVDAAASLGSLDEAGCGFGSGSRIPLVYSMHVTKTFATAEAGVIYSADADLVAELRVMGNFGFGQPRCATMPGMNSKMPEVIALLALKKLEGFDEIVRVRERLAAQYRSELPDCSFQRRRGRRVAYQFMPALLPSRAAPRRADILAGLNRDGIGAGMYFSPHLAEQPYFQQVGRIGPLPVTREVASRAISLPLSDTMSPAEVGQVCRALSKSLVSSGSSGPVRVSVRS